MERDTRDQLTARRSDRAFTRLYSDSPNATTFEPAADGSLNITDLKRCACGAMAIARDNGERAWIECPDCLGMELSA